MTVPAILAAGVDPGAIIAIIFGLISFIGWIVNQVNASQKAPPPPRKRAPRDRSIQDEIDKFLSDQERPPAADSRNRDTPPVPRKAPEPRPQPPRKAPAPAQTPRPIQQQKPRPKGNGNGGNRPQPKSPQPSRTVADAPVSTVSNRGPALGAQVTQHLAEAMAPRIGQTVQQDLPHAVQQSVDKHLGKTRTLSGRGGAEAGSGSAALIVAMLKRPESVRAAIILNEVLAPPPALRRKSGS